MAKTKKIGANILYKEDCEINIWEGDSEGDVSNSQLYMQTHNIGNFNINDFDVFNDIRKGGGTLNTIELDPAIHDYIKGIAREKLYQNLISNNDIPMLDIFNEEGIQLKQLSPEDGKSLLTRHPKAFLLLDESHRSDLSNQFLVAKDLLDCLHTFDEKIRDDKPTALLAVKNDPSSICCLSDKMKGDIEVATIAIKANPLFLNEVSEDLRNNMRFVLEAVKVIPGTIGYASKNIQDIAGDNPVDGIHKAIAAQDLHNKLNKACTPKLETLKPKMKI